MYCINGARPSMAVGPSEIYAESVLHMVAEARGENLAGDLRPAHRENAGDGCRGKQARLFIDNCRTHCSLTALREMAGRNIKVISFPPHMTHVLQPIDAACARAFKAALGPEMQRIEREINPIMRSV
jgi:hypothetical protein